MLSRASRNAYSWWWASHIRTKQSKWLEQNIQDMEEKVEYILKIITEGGDSFRVRAEQYYQKRPELVNFVEDTFRGYRALAERYDHMSKDLQSANRTIAMIFPERVQMSIDEEENENFQSNFDEYDNMVITTNSHVPVPVPVPMPPKQNHLPKMESVVQTMLNKKSKMPRKTMSKKGLVKIGVDDGASNVTKNSGLSKDKAVDEIEKLQKDILGFQTEKEFVKSSYESALSKYWEIEHNINEMHTKISNLQHEFAVGEAMDDHDAQTLMSTSALNMCKGTLDKLKSKQKRFKTEAVVEHNRVDDIRKKFEALIVQNNNDTDLEQTTELHVKDKKEEKELKSFEENGTLVQQEHAHNTKEADNIEEVTVSEVAEKIEQLVDKVITLETDLSSQTALVMRLRFEIDELHEKVQSLEQENKNLVDESNSKNIKIKKLEEELERIQMLDKQINVQNEQLETSFDEASVSVDNLSNDILIAKPDENTPEIDVMIEMEKTQKVPRLEEKEKSDDLQGFVNKLNEKLDDGDEGEHIAFTESDHVKRKDQDHVDCNGEEDEPKCNMLLSHDMDDREKMLLEEYTSTLEKFKELKQRLKETEKQNRARSFKSLVQIKILRKANDSKDAEIRSLCEKIKLLETNVGNHELDKTTDIELMKASNVIDEATQRIEELVETDHFEVQNSKDDDETVDSDDEGTQISRELYKTTSFEQKKTRVDEDHEISEIEEEIRAEIEHFRKENLELWLRFSTSYHQINRFQDSFNDLVQEIKQVEEKKQDRGSGKLRYRHSQSALDIRSIYRHMRDMQTEVVLWLEKNELLEDDLQHRLTSLCDIENELSDLTNVQLDNYQAAKFQGEVLNMKQENVKVLNELREACERVQTLQFDIDKTLSMLDEEVGRIKKSGFSSKVPFKSILFGSKLRKKHKHSMFTRANRSLQKQYSNLHILPQPSEDS
ncbi:protein NETWORKED 2A-like [Bidens hawaiensis]|uniref:protein NETWORKED 2A-like n=1 Tax=Bidens hawaiensis TaxID=980011 RepID=UPI00404B82B7